MIESLNCWACGRYAPAGVCMGPHPGFGYQEMQRAVNVRHVERPARHGGGIRITGEAEAELRRLDRLTEEARRKCAQQKLRQWRREWQKAMAG